MPIRRKDGSIYKLSGPNKIMITQNKWDDEDILTYNFSNFNVVIIDEEEKTIKPNVIIQENKPEPIVLQAPTEVKPSEQQSVFRNRPRQFLFCLPAVMQEYNDALYDEKIQQLGYENPFRFQAHIIGQTDMSFSVWTTLKNITRSSIIFNDQEKRWWKVQEITNDPSGDGAIIRCGPSTIQPNFQ